MSERAKKIRNGLVVQGGILAAAGLIARAIGIVRRIPLTNIIGDVGNGYLSIRCFLAGLLYFLLLITCSSLLCVYLIHLIIWRNINTHNFRLFNEEIYFFVDAHGYGHQCYACGYSN